MGRKAKFPWERLPAESDPAWEAFVLYRDWPVENGSKRTLDKVRRSLGKSQRVIEGWSARYNWRERCNEYDNYLDEEAVRARVLEKVKREKERAEMQDRHVQMSIQLQRVFLEVLKRVDPEEANAHDLSELAKAFQTALAIEATSRGATNADRQLELRREMFEYQKERDAGEYIEYELLEDTEAEIYGAGDGGGSGKGDAPSANDESEGKEHTV